MSAGSMVGNVRQFTVSIRLMKNILKNLLTKTPVVHCSNKIEKSHNFRNLLMKCDLCTYTLIFIKKKKKKFRKKSVNTEVPKLYCRTSFQKQRRNNGGSVMACSQRQGWGPKDDYIYTYMRNVKKNVFLRKYHQFSFLLPPDSSVDWSSVHCRTTRGDKQPFTVTFTPRFI